MAAASDHFAFGENWRAFADKIGEERIASATTAMRDLLGPDALRGKTMLDIGCGSGLHALAALRLGASHVTAIDLDPVSVATAKALLGARAPGAPWETMVADVFALDSLGQFDVVYSWGVLHHTGDVHRAIRCAAKRVASCGLFAIALYNDQGALSRYWLAVKGTYNSGFVGRWAVLLTHMPVLFGARYLWRFATGRLRLDRGMSIWHDAIDWLGGYPFEVMSRNTGCTFMRQCGFALRNLQSVGRKSGCNEFVFQRTA